MGVEWYIRGLQKIKEQLALLQLDISILTGNNITFVISHDIKPITPKETLNGIVASKWDFISM
jgi:hypothetical protein